MTTEEILEAIKSMSIRDLASFLIQLEDYILAGPEAGRALLSLALSMGRGPTRRPVALVGDVPRPAG